MDIKLCVLFQIPNFVKEIDSESWKASESDAVVEYCTIHKSTLTDARHKSTCWWVRSEKEKRPAQVPVGS